MTPRVCWVSPAVREAAIKEPNHFFSVFDKNLRNDLHTARALHLFLNVVLVMAPICQDQPGTVRPVPWRAPLQSAVQTCAAQRGPRATRGSYVCGQSELRRGFKTQHQKKIAKYPSNNFTRQVYPFLLTFYIDDL